MAFPENRAVRPGRLAVVAEGPAGRWQRTALAASSTVTSQAYTGITGSLRADPVAHMGDAI
ncbi:hypothetical protein [Actinoplanes teichomyceticus]|uniref:Uncharacterized protein n=1 Tax=Actinoplanes teichomyceticus TaxID=1867 RepID=A0A561VLR9_ACTTI|nr:hypothetical protein [Actinoplanes teichomyceticus]TWG12549.1 hypothetical protein FHX34_105416 [Actinoplanes teichomyceticus]GIF13915.1 hypothetical protein Ate01nite_39470 [Actinoplanes teichomyceticus]